MDNDKLLIDEIIEKKVNATGETKGNIFEIFAFQQYLKTYDLSDAEIESGLTDGANDGGIDGFYIFVNGNPLNLSYIPKRDISIDVVILTAKHADSFSLAPLESVHSSITELFDFNVENKDLKSTFNYKILSKRDDLKKVFLYDPMNTSRFEVQFVYVSRGETTKIGDNIKDKARAIVGRTEEYLSNSDVDFKFYGSKEILKMARSNFEKSDLVYSNSLRSDDSYVVLTTLSDYFHFISDEKGRIRRYLFDENVRDFLGLNRVNVEIKATLENEKSVNFWNMNNGITIIAEEISQMSDRVLLRDAKIVNGLQTSYTIYNHFMGEVGEAKDNRELLVRLISTKSTEDRNKIIISTNNQSNMQPYSLQSNDLFQIAIDEYFEPRGLYYERRKKYYSNLGKEREQIVTPLYTARIICALIQKQPFIASKLKEKFMNNFESYSTIFDNKLSLDHIYYSVILYKKLETIVVNENTVDSLNLIGNVINDKVTIKNNNFVAIIPVLYIALSKCTFEYSEEDICALAKEKTDVVVIKKIVKLINKLADEGIIKYEKKISRKQLDVIIHYASIDYNILNPKHVTNRKPILSNWGAQGLNVEVHKIEEVRKLIELENITIKNLRGIRDVSEITNVPYVVVLDIVNEK